MRRGGRQASLVGNPAGQRTLVPYREFPNRRYDPSMPLWYDQALAPAFVKANQDQGVSGFEEAPAHRLQLRQRWISPSAPRSASLYGVVRSLSVLSEVPLRFAAGLSRQKRQMHRATAGLKRAAQRTTATVRVAWSDRLIRRLVRRISSGKLLPKPLALAELLSLLDERLDEVIGRCRVAL
jgi:hypothetical protein